MTKKAMQTVVFLSTLILCALLVTIIFNLFVKAVQTALE